jgi:small subunit ribosomal protein S1
MEENNALSGQEVESEEGLTVENPVDEEQQEMASMESLLEEQLNLDFPKQGEIRKGVIATIRENEILIDIGTKSEGVISGRELESIPDEERQAFAVDQEITIYVIAPEDSSGNVVLSYMRAREERDWVTVQGMIDSGEVYDSEVIGHNKGGLIVPVGGLRGFVPASQISLVRRTTTTGESTEQRYANMLNDPIKVCVIEVDRERRRLILSERQALQETRETLKDRLLAELSEGDVRTGRVTSLADFGAFVNIEGADGLVHMSEISWDRIKHPNEVLEVGQEVEVKVISLDHDRKRIGLSIRQLQDDPWVQRVSHLRDGSLVQGTITHLTKFGAFARIADDLEGLIHVSELSEQRIAHPKEMVKEGDILTLRVIKIDPERRRIGLSLRKVDSPAYADLDWKMALAEEVALTEDQPEAEEAAEQDPEAAEAEAEVVEEAAAEAEVVEEEAEFPEVEAEAAEVEAEAPEAEDAEAEAAEVETEAPEAEEEVTEAEDAEVEPVEAQAEVVEAEAEAETEAPEAEEAADETADDDAQPESEVEPEPEPAEESE